MVIMRCISVQQIVRSDIQAGRKILQQLNRAAAASRSTFARWFALTFSIILSCSCVIPFFFRKLRIQIRLYFTKANLLINYHRVFFSAERDKFTQQTHKNEYLHSNYTYFTINSFQKHQYVLVCSATISNFLRFSQVSFSRFHAKN